MDEIAKASPGDREELFNFVAGQRTELSYDIIEKDFWVCWTLRRIFNVLHSLPKLIFKGGTSLSKAYNLIKRFSEDVDLSLSRETFKAYNDLDPEEIDISRTQSEKRIKNLVAECQNVIKNDILPKLKADFVTVIGKSGWNIKLDNLDNQTILFEYPQSNLANRSSYISKAIRLEMGIRSDDWPAENREIKPYAAEVVPDEFTTASSCSVNTLMATRTFWEKVTLLHAEYHRSYNNRIDENRLSRHYYDLYMMSNHNIAEEALKQLNLLERVVQHKKLFFRSAWANYDTAKPGTLHLLPLPERMKGLQNDYNKMKQEMIFGIPPLWEQIIEALRLLEKRINKLSLK